MKNTLTNVIDILLALIMTVIFITGCAATGNSPTPLSAAEPDIELPAEDLLLSAPQAAQGQSQEAPREPPQGTRLEEPLEPPQDTSNRNSPDQEPDGNNPDPEAEAEEPEPPDTLVTLTISAAGDVTLGGDPRFSNQMIREFERQEGDHSVFLQYVKHIFEEDDLTIVNLEGPLTEAAAHEDKGYVFRGPPHFAKILSSSGVDAVTLANNHSKDFLETGYRDTVEALEAEGVAYFGNEFNTVMEIKGIKVGLFGLRVWYDGRDVRDRITAAIGDLRNRGAQLIIAYYHWGEENNNTPSPYQRTMGRFTIDSGADLLLGSHPHVLQGIEEYNGKNIVYSLANFCFGGNNNPPDRDTFIFQQTFTFDDGVMFNDNEINIIPVLVSSESGRNNFQPIVAEGADAERILQRLETYSERLANG